MVWLYAEKGERMNPYIQQIKEIVLKYLHEEPVHVFLFGSWARGTARHDSDVDIAIEYTGGASGLRKIGELRELLEESTIPYRVDVVDMQKAAEGLVQEIRKDGIQWK